MNNEEGHTHLVGHLWWSFYETATLVCKQQAKITRINDIQGVNNTGKKFDNIVHRMCAVQVSI
jgi:hypothetical protein